MYPLYAIILGILVKVYDDIADMNLMIDPHIISSLQTLIVGLFSILAYRDFYFVYVHLVTMIIEAGVEPMDVGLDNPFWKSFRPLIVLFMFVTFSDKGDNFLFKMGFSTAWTLISLVFLYIETVFIPEEYSMKKAFSRVAAWAWTICSLIFLSYTSILPSFVIEPMKKGFYILFGYTLVSSIHQFYLVYTKGLEVATDEVATVADEVVAVAGEVVTDEVVAVAEVAAVADEGREAIGLRDG